jgi:hypothetical protein
MAVIHQLRDDSAHGYPQDVRLFEAELIEKAHSAVSEI